MRELAPKQWTSKFFYKCLFNSNTIHLYELMGPTQLLLETTRKDVEIGLQDFPQAFVFELDD